MEGGRGGGCVQIYPCRRLRGPGAPGANHTPEGGVVGRGGMGEERGEMGEWERTGTARPGLLNYLREGRVPKMSGRT